MQIEDLVVKLSNDSFNPELNFEVAKAYEDMDQFASAISFYMRAAEYGADSPGSLYVYTSLLKTAKCLIELGNRSHTVATCILQAISYMPTRPEAYFFMSQVFENESSWQSCYTWACMGEPYANNPITPLPANIGYYGSYCLMFEKAVSSYWIGRVEESILLFKRLSTLNLSIEYRKAVDNNLERLGIPVKFEVDPLEPVVTNYRKFFGPYAPLIIDIGTRDGDDANFLYTALKGHKVIAIDANPEGVALTKSNYPWMDVRFTAVSDNIGETVFHQIISEDKEIVGCSSIFVKKTEELKDIQKAITVPVTRMDTLLQDVIGLIDVVKVDTEGFTWQVLQGFGLRIKDVKVFHLETEREQFHDNHVTYEVITSFMEVNGFALVDVSYEWGWGIQDQVWVNKALVQTNQEVFWDK